MEERNLYRKCKVCGMHMDARMGPNKYVYCCPMHGEDRVEEDANSEIGD
jgi:hypothetical protein